MWFNEDDDFDEAVMPAANDVIAKKLDPELDSIGKKLTNYLKLNSVY